MFTLFTFLFNGFPNSFWAAFAYVCWYEADKTRVSRCAPRLYHLGMLIPTLGRQIKQIPGTGQMVFKSYLRLALGSFGALLCFCISCTLLLLLPFSLCQVKYDIKWTLHTHLWFIRPLFDVLTHSIYFSPSMFIYFSLGQKWWSPTQLKSNVALPKHSWGVMCYPYSTKTV